MNEQSVRGCYPLSAGTVASGVNGSFESVDSEDGLRPCCTSAIIETDTEKTWSKNMSLLVGADTFDLERPSRPHHC